MYVDINIEYRNSNKMKNSRKKRQKNRRGVKIKAQGAGLLFL